MTSVDCACKPSSWNSVMSTLKQYTRAESLLGAACSFAVRHSHFTCLDTSEAALHVRHICQLDQSCTFTATGADWSHALGKQRCKGSHLLAVL